MKEKLPITDIRGPRGERGDKPDHEWQGTSIRFEKPDGTWGESRSLIAGAQGPQGEKGDQGIQGLPGDISAAVSKSGDAMTGTLTIADGPQSLTLGTYGASRAYFQTAAPYGFHFNNNINIGTDGTANLIANQQGQLFDIGQRVYSPDNSMRGDLITAGDLHEWVLSKAGKGHVHYAYGHSVSKAPDLSWWRFVYLGYENDSSWVTILAMPLEVSGNTIGAANNRLLHKTRTEGEWTGWSEYYSTTNPFGFARQTQSQEWGNQIGSFITGFDDSTTGSIAWRRDNPVNGQMSMVIDGTVYVNEGTERVYSPSNPPLLPIGAVYYSAFEPSYVLGYGIWQRVDPLSFPFANLWHRIS